VKCKGCLAKIVLEDIMDKESTRYHIGLDLGTSSVGWAVVDDDFHLIKKRRKNLWGVRLFDEAKSAMERRLFRRQRRTINKRHWRLHLLKQELKSYVEREDPMFLKRLDRSSSHDDKSHLLFKGQYNDASFHREFPTIYHLRARLLDRNSCNEFVKRGVYFRFLYLVVHDMLKSRGHFNMSGSLSFSDGGIDKASIKNEIQSAIETINGDGDMLDEETILALYDDFMDKNAFNSRRQDPNHMFCKALFGYTFNIASLSEDSDDTKIALDFTDEFWEEKLEDHPSHMDIAQMLFPIYSNIQITKFIGDAPSYSIAKTRVYEKHKEDLEALKEDIRKIDVVMGTSHYHDLFIDPSEDKVSYTSYVGKSITGGKKTRIKKKTSREELIKKLVKIRDSASSSMTDDAILTHLDDENYLEKPSSPVNRLIPNQFHVDELRKILKNFSDVSTRTNVSDAAGISNRIMSLMTFKVPYYAGPLSDKNNSNEDKNQWLVKKDGFDDVTVTPYNFDDVIDHEATNEAFIKRMLRGGTYLYNEPCLQQETITYQSYIFHNTLNKLTVNSTPISMEMKGVLLSLLKKGRKLTKKAIISTLGLDSDSEISGFSNDESKPLNVSMSAWIRFSRIFPDHKDNPFYQRFFDHVVNQVALFDIDALEARETRVVSILKNHPNITANNEQIAQLARLRSKKWGNLSEKFLLDIRMVDKNGVVGSVLELMENSSMNLMEILYAHPDNLAAIDRINGETPDLSDPTKLHDYLKLKYISPQARRSIIQANRIVDEIVRIMDGVIPTSITLEFTRERQDKPKETNSRFYQIKQAYKNMQSDSMIEPQAEHKLVSLEETKKEDRLKAKRVYLYFLQLGKDMYTGEPINFEELDTRYDIDHIFPQSRIKDDSLDNMVLVSNTMNMEKGNTYPLSETIQTKMNDFWQYLRHNKLISPKKLDRLTRKTPLSEDELNDFVNRQKTTLDWINLETADIFKKKFNRQDDPSFVIYSKSRHVSDYRNNISAYKVRELNNLHHAHDAYLNVVVGRTLKTCLSVYDKNRQTKSHNIDRILEYKLESLKPYIIGTSEKKGILDYHDVLVTKKTEIKNTGGYWDQQIVAPSEKGSASLLPIKNDMDVNLYGGYRKASTAFFTVVRKANGTKEIIPIKTVECNAFYNGIHLDQNKLEQHVKSEYGSTVICPVIPVNTKVLLEQVPLRIAGKTNNNIIYHNVTELILSPSHRKYLRLLLKSSQKMKQLRAGQEFSLPKEITSDNNVELYGIIHESVTKDRNKNTRLFSKNIHNQILREQPSTSELFSTMSIEDQMDTLVTIVTRLLKANTSNQGKLFGKSYIDFTKNCKIKYDFSIIKESVTGFYTKRVDIHNVSDSSH
jgi:CRISPR-associated endonuclease Csn1